MIQFPIKLKVKPNSKKTEILRKENNEIVLAVKSHAENNKANLEIIKFFAKELKTKIRIVKGLKSRNKIIQKLK